MRILDTIYRKFGESDFLNDVVRIGVPVHFVVEAGCHDGSDTIKILKILKPQKVFAFEPDPEAFVKATDSLKYYANKKVELYQHALSNFDGDIYIDFLQQSRGIGISTLSKDKGDSLIKAKRLDSFLKSKKIETTDEGVLWLDVEGHALSALQGAAASLHNFSAAKIEVQMHSISETKLKDFREVIKIMKIYHLNVLRAPLHPGFSGDIVFIRRDYLTARQIIISRILEFLMVVLHNLIYPALGKPKR